MTANLRMMTPVLRLILLLLLSCLAVAHAQESISPASVIMTTEDGGRFVAVHGRRSTVMGYGPKGLEVWAYPFQILRDYHVGFRQKGAASEVDARSLLRRIDYRPDSVTRTYVGPDYLVRETFFIPLDQPAAAILYEVEGSRTVDIEIHFEPVLNLMWPGSVGGQYTRWLEDAPGYQVSEPEHGVSALVASPETIAHDDTVNSTVASTIKSLTVQPRAGAHGGASRAEVYVMLNAANAKDPAAAVHELASHLEQERQQAAAHYVQLHDHALRLHTPDEEVNRAVAWAETALDQAWVCNPLIGCGLVAGYGPSRDARRPQYAWFFAGDGLIATNALISAGEYARAKQELEFIEKYQQPSTGMIWHELSQSAGYIDWSKYPYMYVHVDITFDYLATLARYVAVSGDAAYAKNHWPSIEKAYLYCRSLVRDSDHLPHIPADKEAGDEQARPGDDLGLSAGWLAATEGYAEVARLTGHTLSGEEAVRQNRLTRASIPTHYWNSEANFWLDGHTQGGAPIASRRRGPSQLLEQHVFSAQQETALLDQLASSDFQADWGLREVAASAPDYDPYSYGRGSITAPSTAYAAITFWKEHRPATGTTVWNELLPWNTLDSPGHIHEVLAGNFYHEQAESVPEQTWSSAGLLDAAVRGLLGLEVHGAEHTVEFAPHLPAQWEHTSIENVQLPGGKLDFFLTQGIGEVDLEIRNLGDSTRVFFHPQLPLGAKLVSATFEGHPIAAELKTFPEDRQAAISLEATSGTSRVRVQFAGGVSVLLPQVALHPGDASTGLKLIHVSLHDHVLSIDADVNAKGSGTVTLRTPWKLTAQQGATVEPVPDNQYRVTLVPELAQAGTGGYTRVHAALTVVP